LLVSTVYVLATTLDTVSPLIRERVYFETERRILQPLLAQNFGWMGLATGRYNRSITGMRGYVGTG
jgi:hypothetical protein